MMYKTGNIFIYGLMLIGLISSCSKQEQGFPEGIEHVVVIGIDGLSVEGLRNAKTPVMDSMIANGSISWNARTVLPSVSSPNWASMIMGAGPEQHGITSNDWEFDDHTIEPIVRGADDRFPSIFGVIRKQLPDADIASLYHWNGFGRLYDARDLNFDQSFSTADSTTDATVGYILENKPAFTFVHLDDVDGAGHGTGHGTVVYLNAISRMDSLIGRIIEATRQAGIGENTMIMITSDHGGIGYGHGGESREEITIPVILFGKGVKENYIIQQPVYMYDIAATIAFALKVKAPYSWIGRPIKAAFEGYEEPETTGDEKVLISSPLILPERDLYEQAGGLYIDQAAEVIIKPVLENAVVRFTTDGTEPTGESPEYKEPFQLQKTSVVKAKSFDAQGNESLSSVAYFRLLKKGNGNGLQVSFYPGDGWKFLPVFKNLTPSERWQSHEFQINREKVQELIAGRSSNFALLMEGFLQIDTAGDYTFYTHSDDGSKLYVNDELVVDNDGDHGVRERVGKIRLDKGKHTIRAEFFNGGGGYWLDVFYKGPGLAKQMIPADKLFLTKQRDEN